MKLISRKKLNPYQIAFITNCAALGSPVSAMKLLNAVTTFNKSPISGMLNMLSFMLLNMSVNVLPVSLVTPPAVSGSVTLLGAV